MRYSVVIWDSDIVWVESLRMILEKHNISCGEADDKDELFAYAAKNPVLGILSKDTIDETPDVPGEIFMELKEISDFSMIMVMEDDDVQTELSALSLGAVDVLIKRKGVEIAAARILGFLKRNIENFYVHSPSKENSLENSQMLFETFFFGIHLTPTERKVLFELYKEQENVVSRKELIRRCWKDRKNKNDRVVDTVMKQLRKKLKNTTYQVQGIYGLGYLLKKR